MYMYIINSTHCAHIQWYNVHCECNLSSPGPVTCILHTHTHTVLPLDITPRYGNVLGGETIKISGPCFEEGDEITCRFNGEETFGLYLSKLEALCVVPLLGNTVGQITLEVFLKGALKGRATFTTCKFSRTAGTCMYTELNVQSVQHILYNIVLGIQWMKPVAPV